MSFGNGLFYNGVTGASGLFLKVAFNLSDVANASTSNHNLGNNHGQYTPTFTPTNDVLNTCTALQPSLYIIVDTESITFSVTVNISLNGLNTDEIFEFDLPILPDNNFASKYDLNAIVSKFEEASSVPIIGFSVGATGGAKTGSLTFFSNIAATSSTLVIMGTYHK